MNWSLPLIAKKPPQHLNHIPMILHTGAFADAVHRPHRAADIDTAEDAELCRGDRADGAAARQVATVRVALIGNTGFFAPLDEACGGNTFGAVATIGVGFDHWAFVDENFVIYVIGRGEVRVIGMRHVRADQETLRQCTCRVFALRRRCNTDALQHIGQKAAGGADMAFAADFFVIEKRANQRALNIVQDGIVQQGLQPGMTGNQVIDLTVSVKLLIRAPECALLRVVNCQIPR